jgi:hypothetical protein
VEDRLGFVIQQVNDSLKALIRRGIPPEVSDVDFRAPSPEWAGAAVGPRINLFMYELAEERAARGADWVDQRDETGRVTLREPPLRTYRLSYLVSAWSPAGEGNPTAGEEQALLGEVLRVLVEADQVPGSGRRQDEPEDLISPELSVAEPFAEGVRPHDLWSSLGMPLRPCFQLMVKAPLRTGVSLQPAAAVDTIRLSTAPDGPGRPAGTPRNGSPRLARPPTDKGRPGQG